MTLEMVSVISFNMSSLMRLMPIQRRTKLSIDISDEDKLEQRPVFSTFSKRACGQKELQNALQLDSKFVSFILNECCVRQNKHKWALHPDYTVDF
jgi:hypothetical protein